MDPGDDVATLGTAPLDAPLWFAQLLITFMFATGFISYYRRIWQVANNWFKDKPAYKWLIRVVVALVAIGIGTALHMVGWLVFTNATGLMFHNMGLFGLTFILLDEHVTWWEYAIRVAGVADVWLMHHMGYFDRPQFVISAIGALIGLGVLWFWRNHIRYRVWRHIGAYMFLGISFWTLLPPHSAGLTVTPAIIIQGLSMYFVMVVVTAITLSRDHKLDVQNAVNAQLAQYDSLTNAKSASIYRRDVTHFFQEAHEEGHHLTVAAIDIDQFKQINDHYGHLVGDDVLIGVARSIDTELSQHQGRHSLYRTGGEEFSIVFVDATLDAVREIVTAVWQTVQKKPFDAGEYTVKTTLSIGVAELHQEDHSFDDVFARADASLYQSKHNGRNAITIGDVTLNSDVKHHVMATRTLISQAVLDATVEGTPIQAQEVLLARYEYDHDRWNFPTDFVIPIDVQLNYIRELLATGTTHRVMLHLSELQFVNPETPARLTAFIDGEPMKVLLMVEVDHNIQVTALAENAARYQQVGIEVGLINLDARKSLSVLRPRLPYVNLIKLSCASVRDRYPDGLSDPELQTWEKAIRPNHLKLVINGIENSQDAAFVREKLHVQYLQGYYYDRPELPRLA